jgi:hypothetical protein
LTLQNRFKMRLWRGVGDSDRGVEDRTGLNDPVTLAERYIGLVKETEDVRAQMRRLLANGADSNPTVAARAGVTTSSQRSSAKYAKAQPSKAASRQRVMAEAAKAETQVLEILKTETDGLKTADIARRAGMPPTSVQNRLMRLQRAGLIERSADERWSASAPS